MDLMLMVFFISFLIVTLGAVFKKMQDIFLTEPLLAMVFGILLGPDVLNFIKSNDTAHEFEVLKYTCEFTIAMALMATALRIPGNFFRNNATTQTRVVIFGMLLMWISSSILLYWALNDFSIAECLLLGAIITPTDPVVASTIVSGEKAKKYLPLSIRGTLSFESAANDGLAYPLVILALFLVNSTKFPIAEWLIQSLLYETLLCIVIAYAVGFLGGKLLHKAHQAGYMSEKTLLPFSLALAFLLLSGLDSLGMNGIIGVFVGGLGFAFHISKNEDLEEKKVQEAMERIFTIPVFFILGIILPWEEWYSMGWTAVWIILLILFLRRIPAFLALMPFLPQFRKKTSDILTLGWFGPIGVAALYYAIESKEKTGLEEVWTIPSLVVFASTIVHGISSVPLERIYFKFNGKDK